MSNPKVTVLIAVYNTEKYLAECIDSLLRQTYGNLEILCVDDCSSDSSLSILRDYEARDNRIHVWKQKENAGQAKARNAAMLHATGDIIMFLDSDDWLADDAVEQMVRVFQENEQTDSVLFNVRYIYEDGREHGYKTPPFERMDGYTAFRESLTWNVHGWYASRAYIYKENPYDDTCRHYSDDNTTRIHYLKSREVRCCNGKYYYRQLSSSVTHGVSTSLIDFLKANESMKRQLTDLGCSDDIMTIYENERWLTLLSVCVYYVRNRKALSASDRQLFRKEIRRIWNTIETERLYRVNTMKPGYYPFRWCWPLFFMEYHLFGLARTILRR